MARGRSRRRDCLGHERACTAPFGKLTAGPAPLPRRGDGKELAKNLGIVAATEKTTSDKPSVPKGPKEATPLTDMRGSGFAEKPPALLSPRQGSAEVAPSIDKKLADKNLSDKKPPDAEPKNPQPAVEPIATVAAAEHGPPVKAAAKPERVAIPSKQSQTAAEQVILGIYKADLDQANRGTPAVKIALAKKLQQQAVDTADDPGARYLLFSGRRNWPPRAATRPSRSARPTSLPNDLPSRGQKKNSTCCSRCKRTLGPPKLCRPCCRMPTMRSIRRSRTTSTTWRARSRALASGWAAKLHNPQLVAQAKVRAGEVEQTKKEYAKSLESAATLEKQPDDPDANFAVGYFEGPIKGDFTKSLPKLAKGSEPKYRELAKNELAEPTDAAPRSGAGRWLVGPGRG